jgi:hypothetical protein
MSTLADDIAAVFTAAEPPRRDALVVWDGFDQLDKEAALDFYAGKRWEDVLAHLRGLKDAPLYGAAFYLEEWAVLSPRALAYHARAHLGFLLETLAEELPDEQYVFYFLGQLEQLVRRGAASPFSPAQTSLLRRVVERVDAQAAEGVSFEYYEDDIRDQAAKVLSAIDSPTLRA